MNPIKKVAIVVPNYTLRDEYGAPSSPPIGPAMVAAAVRAEGYEVDLIDGDVYSSEIPYTKPAPEAFAAALAASRQSASEPSSSCERE